jgi:opacity protein-like surface antigen
MTRLIRAVTLVLALAAPSAALAQGVTAADAPSGESFADASQLAPRRPAPPRRPRPPIGLRAYAFSDSTEMTAAETFTATLGSKTMTGLGGGFEVLNLWSGLFARLDFSQSSAAGQRVVFFEDEAIPLGIPMHVTLNPLEAGAGWRVDLGRRRLVGVYGGGSLLRMRFRQTSDFADPDEDIDDTTNGFAAFGGVDVTIARWVMIGAEGQYRRVPNAIGQDGVSEAFGENDLGGLTFRVLFGIRR